MRRRERGPICFPVPRGTKVRRLTAGGNRIRTISPAEKETAVERGPAAPTIVVSRDDLCLMTPSSVSVRHLSSAQFGTVWHDGGRAAIRGRRQGPKARPGHLRAWRVAGNKGRDRLAAQFKVLFPIDNEGPGAAPGLAGVALPAAKRRPER